MGERCPGCYDTPQRDIKVSLGAQERLCKKATCALNFQKERSWVSVKPGYEQSVPPSHEERIRKNGLNFRARNYLQGTILGSNANPIPEKGVEINCRGRSLLNNFSFQSRF